MFCPANDSKKICEAEYSKLKQPKNVKIRSVDVKSAKYKPKYANIYFLVVSRFDW